MRTLADSETDQPAAKPKESTTAREAAAVARPTGVLRRGRVTLRNSESIDFDTGEVGDVAGTLWLYSVDPADGIIYGGPWKMVVSTGPNTKAGCVKALKVRSTSELSHPELPAGTLVCQVTPKGSIVAFRIIRPVALGRPQLTFAYTVWR